MARSIIPTTEHIARSILVLRGQRVLLDTELAELYGITTKRFNEQVRRNRERFPADFTFQLTAEEAEALRSQIGDGSGNSVDRMTVANHCRSKTQQGRCPQ